MKALITILLSLAPVFAQAYRCPMPDSREEREIILQDGPVYIETGAASYCLGLIIKREKEVLGFQGADDRDLVNILMSSSIKAEMHEKDESY